MEKNQYVSVSEAIKNEILNKAGAGLEWPPVHMVQVAIVCEVLVNLLASPNKLLPLDLRGDSGPPSDLCMHVYASKPLVLYCFKGGNVL